MNIKLTFNEVGKEIKPVLIQLNLLKTIKDLKNFIEKYLNNDIYNYIIFYEILNSNSPKDMQVLFD